MDPGELNSKSPGRNLFDPGSLGHPMFGASPTASLYAHYAHLPNSLSLLGHPSAFPAQLSLSSSPYGGLGSLAVTSASSFTTPSGAAWWPMASRLLAPDYLMRSLAAASTTSTTFGSISRDSGLPGFDALNQQAHHPSQKIEHKSPARKRLHLSSPHTSSSSPPPVRSSPSRNSSSRNLPAALSSPIYTNPSTGVTITPITYDDKSSDSRVRQNGSTLSSSPSSSPSSSSVRNQRLGLERHSTSAAGVHMLPVAVVTKNSASYPLSVTKLSKSHGSSRHSKSDMIPTEATDLKMKRDSFSSVSSRSSNRTDLDGVYSGSCSASSCDESTEITRHKKKRHRRRIDGLLGQPGLRSAESTALNSLPLASVSAKESISIVPTSSNDAPSLDLSDSAPSPLNLSLKQHPGSSASPQPPVLIPAAMTVKKKRSSTKRKNSPSPLEAAELLEKQLQTDFRAHFLENHLKHQMHLEAAVRKLNAQHHAKEANQSHDCHSQSSSPQLQFQTNKLKSPPTPHVVITTAAPTSQPKSSSQPAPNIVTITAIPSSNKAISLLTGAPAIMKAIPESSAALASTVKSKSSLLGHSKIHSAFGSSSSLSDGISGKKHHLLCTPTKKESVEEDKDITPGEGSADEAKKLVAKFRTLEEDTSDDESSEEESSDESAESSSKSETSSSESESESESTDTEDTEQSQTTSTGSTPVPSSHVGLKRSKHHDHSGTLSPVKRRRIIVDEKELRIPLEHGWRRQTKIRTFSYSGVRGVVTYFAPCGKKLKTYPEVIRYLDKNKINDITRENFSFSTKVNIGEFLESVDGVSEFVSLGEHEVLARIDEVRATRGRRSGARGERRRTGESKHRTKDGSRMRRRMEQQEVARRAHEMKMRRKLDRERAVMAAKEAKKMKVIEAKKMKEHERLIRQQEKYERQEQMRLEKEMRAQQMIEARKKRQEEIEKQRVEEAVKKTQEREMKRQQAVFLKEQEQQKRREMLLMVDLERERRRQHMLLVKALEAHKKQEERERIREERKVEKLLNKERKMEQRKLELQALRELKKPIEDMEITDAQPLPTLNRIPGVKLPGQAFADILMVLEFLHNFGETLGFDMHHLPTLNTLQMAMLNNEDAEEELMSTLHHLLTCAIDDPGTLVNTKHLSVLGHTLKDVDITGYTMSEVLRIYIVSQTGEESDMSKWLKERPYLSLNATQKAGILAFVCNELLCSRGICRQIDNSIETVHNLRREKWMVEGNLRKLKTVHFKKFSRSQNKMESNQDEDKEKGDKDVKLTPPPKAANKGDEDDEAGNESGNESEGSNGTGQGEIEADEPEDEEMGMSSEDLKKQIDKLSKQLNQFRNKLLKSSQQLRAMSFGQDRYKRRYWVLPYAGGMFVEGMESAEAPEDMFSCSFAPVLEGIKDEEGGEPPQLEAMKNMKCEVGSGDAPVPVPAAVSVPASVPMPDVGKNRCLEPSSKRTSDKATNCIVKEEIKKENSKRTESNLFLRKPEELGNLSDCIKNSDSNSPVPSLTASEKTAFNHAQFPGIPSGLVFPPSLGSPCKELNGSAYMNFLKCDTSAQQNGGFTSVLGFPQYPFSAEQMLKTMGDKIGLKPWFSVLPRMPCDETSLTRLHRSPSKNSPNSSSSKFSPLPYSAFSMYSSTPSFATLQMGVINGTPSPFGFGHTPPSPRLVLPSPIHRSPTPNRSGVSFSNVSSMATSSVNAPPSQSNDVAESGPNGTGDCLPVLEKLAPSAEVKPIPIELQRGWWRITDANQLKTLMALLHQRGLRERILFKQLERYEDFACQSCGKGNNDAIDLEITDLDRKVSQLPGGAPEEDDPDTWFPDVALRVDLALLEHIESIEDRVINSSMQSKSWKPLPKASTDESIKFRPVCAPAPEKSDKTATHSPLEFCQERLLALQTYIEPRYIKPPLGTSTSELNFSNLSSGNNASTVTKDNSIEDSKEDGGGDSKDNDKESADQDEGTSKNVEEPAVISDDTPPGLTHWRKCVQQVQTSAQLAMCLTALENCIAWDKSIMKASCQFCNSGDNEAMLLLCDGCDKGYHTYCFKPKMENIPEGDWFCNECINKATGDTMCMVCSKKGKNLCICDTCPKAYHIDCLDPPLSRPPKGKWHCPRCHQRPNKSKSKNSSQKKKEAKKDDESTESSTKPEKSSSAKGSAKDRNTKDKRVNLDFTPCRSILEEMENHEDSWPFLLPVNTKQFPSYRKVIKKPMDLSTMRNKLVDGSYKSREEFANDARCIFDNCETFNEDDSPVGKAGHNLRAFFETRWSEATGN